MDKQLKEFLSSHKVGESLVRYQETEFTYWIISADIPGLPDFVGFPDGEILFISTKVPEEYRNYFLIHEIIELTDPEVMNESNRCVLALRGELNLVPDNINDIYLEYRLSFFERLISYSVTNGSDQEFLGRITASRDLLKTLVSTKEVGKMPVGAESKVEKATDRAAKRLLDIDMVNPRIIQNVIRDEFGSLLASVPDAHERVIERTRILQREGYKPGQKKEVKQVALKKHVCDKNVEWWKETFPTLTKDEQEAAVKEVNESNCVLCRRAFLVGLGE